MILKMFETFIGLGVVSLGIGVLVSAIGYFSFDTYFKPKLNKFVIWLLMNHLGILDKDTVEDKGKYLLIKYIHVGTQYSAVIPLGPKIPRGRRVYLVKDGKRTDITNMARAMYNFTANQLGVDGIVISQNKLGTETDVRTYSGDDTVIVM